MQFRRELNAAKFPVEKGRARLAARGIGSFAKKGEIERLRGSHRAVHQTASAAIKKISRSLVVSYRCQQTLYLIRNIYS